MKKLFDKLDKKYKVNERLGFSYQSSTSPHQPQHTPGQHPQIAGPQQQYSADSHPQGYGQQFATPPGQQQYAPPPGQQQFAPPPGQQQYTPPPGQQQFAPPPGQQQFSLPPGQQQFPPPPQQFAPPPAQQQFAPPPTQQQFPPPPTQGSPQHYTPPPAQQFLPPPSQSSDMYGQQQHSQPSAAHGQQHSQSSLTEGEQLPPPQPSLVVHDKPPVQYRPGELSMAAPTPYRPGQSSVQSTPAPATAQQFAPPPGQSSVHSTPAPAAVQQFPPPPGQSSVHSTPAPSVAQQFPPPPVQNQPQSYAPTPPPVSQFAPPPLAHGRTQSHTPTPQFPPPPVQNRPQSYAPTPPPAQAQFAPPPPQQTAAPVQEQATTELTLRDINRYRTAFGANLGSIFVLEKWLFPTMYEGVEKGGSELAAVSAHWKRGGLEPTKAAFEKHWANAMTPDDWVFLKSSKTTSLRLPIGWWTLGPFFCSGTSFKPYGEVYTEAWAWVKNYIYTAANHRIGVLIDLHALPGGANEEEHSGTDTYKSEFWDNEEFKQLAIEALVFIAREVRDDPILRDWVVGIQVVNEATVGAGARGMWNWYDAALAAIAQVDTTLPVYISDSWDTKSALDYASHKNTTSRVVPGSAPPVVVDMHKYYCFAPDHKTKSPTAIIELVATEGSEIAGYEGAEVGTVVGEWSCVLDTKTWALAAPESRDQLVRAFGEAQTARWKALKPVNGGAYFWTAKMAWMDGGEWGFVEQVRRGNVRAPAVAAAVQKIAGDARFGHAAARDTAVKEHAEYWGKLVKEEMEHWRFAEGYDVGFSDALGFWEGGEGATVGFVNLWTGKRMREHAAKSGGWTSRWLWEFEHGVKRGIRDMEAFVR